MTLADQQQGEHVATSQMLLTVIYDSGIDESVMALVAEAGLPGWTKIDGVHGYGGTGYRLDTPIWPGLNTVLLLALTEAQAVDLARQLRELQSAYRRKPGITLLLQPVTLL